MEMQRITFGNRQNFDSKTYTLDHTGINKQRSLQTKPYWNGKIAIGRFIENYEGQQIIFYNLQNSDSFSRKHAEISIKRFTKKSYVSKRFINFLLCLSKSKMILVDDAIKIIYSFYVKPEQYQLDSVTIFKPYALVRDLGSLSGTKVKINKSYLQKESTYMLSEDFLFIEYVQNEGTMYEDGHFFRNIPKDYIVIISPDYLGNYYEDVSQVYKNENEKCGFPYVKVRFMGSKYFLIATKAKLKFLLGREEDCDITSRKSNFSRVQAVIEYDQENLKWVIKDGSFDPKKPSANGTYKVLNASGNISEWEVMQNNEILINDMKVTLSLSLDSKH